MKNLSSSSPEWKSKVDSKIKENRERRASSKSKYVSKSEEEDRQQKSKLLLVSFVAMIFVGLGNKIFQKLQTIPMRNYPIFLNILTTFIYIPLSFAYIVPMIKYGTAISNEQLQIPKSKFAVMGFLDSIAGIMQVFAATYLGGSLLILLGQAAIPVSMLISRLLLNSKYSAFQYSGALIVVIGLLIVLIPSMGSHAYTIYLAEVQGGANLFAWSLVMILSSVPMCLSSVYKERALGEAELNPIYLNGWIAIFQFILAIPLSLPAAYVGEPQISPRDLARNILDGFKCYLGQDSIMDGPNPDHCEMATLYVTIYLLFNVTYNVLIILILKYGSANILWLAMTIMVPLGNVAFTFHFMPDHQPLKATDVLGLFVIMFGLITYRFLSTIVTAVRKRRRQDFPDNTFTKSLLSFDDDDVEVEVNRIMSYSMRGLITITMLPCLAMVAVVFIYVPLMLVILVHPSIYIRISAQIGRLWFTAACFLLETVCGIQLEFYSAEKQNYDHLSSSSSIVFSNHRTRIDWMFLWCLFQRWHCLHTLRIILKDGLRKVPFLGWAMQHLRFLFLKRNWETDKPHMTETITRLRECSDASVFLIFPEGTDLSQRNKDKSNQFAHKAGLPDREYTLYPRTTGWNHLVSLLRDKVDHIYDVTMFFVDHTPGDRASEQCFITGRFPRCISFYIQQYRMDQVPEDSSAWLQERFTEKEERLKQYYTNAQLPSACHQIWADTSVDSATCLVFWGLLVSLFLIGMIWWSMFRWYVLTVMIFYRFYFTESRRLDTWILSRLTRAEMKD